MQTGKGFEEYETSLCLVLLKEAQCKAVLLRAKMENLSQADLIPSVRWQAALPRVSFRLHALTWLSLTMAAWLLPLCLGPWSRVLAALEGRGCLFRNEPRKANWTLKNSALVLRNAPNHLQPHLTPPLLILLPCFLSRVLSPSSLPMCVGSGFLFLNIYIFYLFQ